MRRTISGVLAFAAVTTIISCEITAAGAASVPDLTGVWGWDAAGGVDKKFQPPPPGPPPLKPKYQAEFDAWRAEKDELVHNNHVRSNSAVARIETECLPYGMPKMMQEIYSLEILQSPRQVTIIAEAMPETRRIYLDRPQLPIDEVPPGYVGRSVGHYEGHTLVVDTVGIKPEVRDNQGMPHSGQMRIIERISRIAPDILQDQITIEDPIALERPYTFTLAYKRLKNYETPEYVCDNRRETIDEKGQLGIRTQKP